MKCDYCGSDHSPNDIFVDTEGKFICPNCISRNYLYRCNECGRVFKPENSSTICDECANKVYDKYINPYSTKPKPIFTNKYGKEGNKLRYYGVELELSHTNPSLIFNFFRNEYKNKLMLNKSDSSLMNGVEINISPMDRKTLFEFLERNKEKLEKVKGEHSYDNAGIHVHVNRNSLVPQDIIKLSYLINLKTKENKVDFFTYLCGRSNKPMLCKNPTYCVIAAEEFMKDLDKICERHIGLNVTPKDTIEFRLFKSSLEIDTIKSYIYIVDSLIEFVHNNPINKININNYLIYLNTKQYNTEYLKERIQELDKVFCPEKITINNYSIDGWYNLFKGISWKKYPQIVGKLSCYDKIDKRLIKMTLTEGNCYGYTTEDYLYNNRVLNKLLETYKKTMVNLIIRKEHELCA